MIEQLARRLASHGVDARLWPYEDRYPTHGYDPTREAAMLRSRKAGGGSSGYTIQMLHACPVLTCETLGHARAHGCRTRLYRDVATRVRRGRRKHWPSEKLAYRIDPPRAPVAASAPPSRAKKLQLWAAKKLQSE